MTEPPLPPLEPAPGTPFGIYVHVPFCASRCGYCDFNTYTPGELADGAAGAPGEPAGVAGVRPLPRGSTPLVEPAANWLEGLRRELGRAAELLDGSAGITRVDTVFVGGGTPSLLGGTGLAEVLDVIRSNFDLAAGAEVSTEANPESTSPEFFEAIRAAGYTRVSLGMQSAAPHVLALLDRVHSPGRAPEAAREARRAGFEHVNLDLIYGTPGESDADLIGSIEAVLEAQVDHVSAYALVVEDGTALARRVRRGEMPAVDQDTLADRYELLDARLSAAGLHWYEVSNWSAPGGECRHNLGYWNGGQWWGAGPGAHSHVGALRWWNIKHPYRYADSLSAGTLPVAGWERLDATDRHVEEVLLRIRLRDGLPERLLDGAERERAAAAVADELLRRDHGRLVLTDRGRLLADGVVRDLLD